MAIETQIVLIYGAQSGFFDELDISDVMAVKEFIIRFGEYSPYSVFIDVHSKLKEFKNSAESILEYAYSSLLDIKNSK
jgi:hypothetical protein